MAIPLSLTKIISELEFHWRQITGYEETIFKKDVNHRTIFDMIHLTEYKASKDTIRTIYMYATGQDIEEQIALEGSLPKDYESLSARWMEKLLKQVNDDTFSGRYSSLRDVEDIFEEVYERGFLEDFSNDIVESKNEILIEALLYFYYSKFDSPFVSKTPKYAVEIPLTMLNSKSEHVREKALQALKVAAPKIYNVVDLDRFSALTFDYKYIQKEFDEIVEEMKELKEQKQKEKIK